MLVNNKVLVVMFFIPLDYLDVLHHIQPGKVG